MRRRQFIGQTVATLVAQQAASAQGGAGSHRRGVKASPAGKTAARAAKDSRRPRGEWPLPGQNNRYLAQAELPARMPRAPKELWSYDLGRAPVSAAIYDMAKPCRSMAKSVRTLLPGRRPPGRHPR